MKLAFDEHLPPAMAEVFESLAKNRGIRKLAADLTIQQAKHYAPDPTDTDYLRRNDAPWVRRFATSGGDVIISGDQKMRSRAAEREALVQAGMVVFFFDSAWSSMQFCDKCAMLLHWWPHILESAKTAPKPSFWRVPAAWKSDTGVAQVPHTDLNLERIERQKAAAPKVRARRAAQRRRNNDEKMLPFSDDQKDEP